jgi:hypothetical protein
VIDAGRSDKRVHDDLDLTSWRPWIDHDKQLRLLEHWDAYGSPGDVANDQRLSSAHARGHLWLQGRQCSYPSTTAKRSWAHSTMHPYRIDEQPGWMGRGHYRSMVWYRDAVAP